MSDDRGPAASGARLLGDDYQHLLTWLYAAQLLHDDPDVVRVEIEKHGAGNVDDLVVHRRGRRPDYHQVKFTTKPGEPLTAEWFVDPGQSSLSPLQRFHKSWVELTDGAVTPGMALHTNRLPVAGDALLACLDGSTLKLVPKLTRATPGSDAGKIRAGWATHLGVGEDELLTLLGDLEIRAGRASLSELREHCSWVMDAVGLVATGDAIDIGMLAARRWVEDGVREVVADTVAQLVDEKLLRAPRRRATVLIQAIVPDPMPELADVAINWIDAFAEDRRAVTDDGVWQGRFAADLHSSEAQTRAAGISDVRLAGTFRLTPALYAGTVFSDTMQYKVAIPGRSGDGRWNGDVTSDGPQAPVVIERDETSIGAGEELAVGLGVAADVADDVLAHLRREQLPISHFVNLRLPTLGRQALDDAMQMRGWSTAVTDALRSLAKSGVPLIHLFLSVPRPAAVLLGHQWNRMPPAQLWEEAPQPGRYFPSFLIAP